MVKVTLHGEIGEVFGREWNINALTIAECLHAIEVNTKKFRQFFLLKEKENAKYVFLINGEAFDNRELDQNKPETIYSSELYFNNPNLKSLDIIPILEGATVGAIITALVVAIVVAVATYFLTPRPNFGDFREIEQGGKTSYLFSGPENVTGEGGPVPIGYGRLIIGSQVIAAAYVVRDFNTNDGSFANDQFGNLIELPPKPPIVSTNSTKHKK